MSIQFCCTQCGQPIEVDDEHGGRTAACPYCRHVMAVPQQSTYNPDAAVTARPFDPPALAGSDAAEAGGGAPAVARRAPFVSGPQRRAANTFGTVGLICSALALLLYAASAIGAAVVMFQSGIVKPGAMPAPDQIKQIEDLAGQQPLLVVAQFAGMGLAVVGLVLGIVSLTQARWNWRGTTAVVGCALLLLCVCGSAVFAGAAGLGTAAR